jgi:hypothetical protein
MQGEKTEIVKREIKPKYVDLPDISIQKAIALVQKLLKEYGGIIIPYDDFIEIIGIKGGALAGIIRTLKSYGLVEKFSKSEYKITEIAQDIANQSVDPDTAVDLLLALLSSSGKLIANIDEKYGGTLLNNPKNVNKKTIEKYLRETEKLSEQDATKMARITLENYEYIYSVARMKPSTEARIKEEFENKRENGGISQDAYIMAMLVGQLFPLETKEEIEIKMDELLNLAQKNDLPEFFGVLSGIKSIMKTCKDKEEMFAILKKSSSAIVLALDTSFKIKRNKEGE